VARFRRNALPMPAPFFASRYRDALHKDRTAATMSSRVVTFHL
jgi:hypothetical protein